MYSDIKMKIVGLGGCGGNIINTIIESGVDKIEFIHINDSNKSLDKNIRTKKLIIGDNLLNIEEKKDNPKYGRELVFSIEKDIRDIIGDAEILFIIAGLGGSIGSGGSPVVAQVAHEIGIFTSAILVNPFSFEGPKRKKNAEYCVEHMINYVDSLITVENNSMINKSHKGESFFGMIQNANKIVCDLFKKIYNSIIISKLNKVDGKLLHYNIESIYRNYKDDECNIFTKIV